MMTTMTMMMTMRQTTLRATSAIKSRIYAVRVGNIIDIMFFLLLFYVFTFLFNMYRLLFTVILSRLTSCK